jgi:hypothetical protein
MPEILILEFLQIKLKKNARIISFSIFTSEIEKNTKLLVSAFL